MDLIQARTQTGLRVALEHLRGALSDELGRIREGLTRLLVEVEAGIDFSDEGITFIAPQALAAGIEKSAERVERLIQTAEDGRIVRQGVTAALDGRPYVGTSRLLYTVARADRAVGAPIPGT